MSRRKSSSTSSTRPNGVIRKSGRIQRQHDDWEWATYEGYLDNVIWLHRVTGYDQDSMWS